MPVLLLHLTAIHRLADRFLGRLPPAWSEALQTDLPYARFGAALPLLPTMSGWGGALGLRSTGSAAEGFARRFHALAPMQVGLKMADLVARGALVGENPGRALLAGYFTHLCVDSAILPIERRGGLQRELGETSPEAQRQLAWAHAIAAVEDTFSTREPFRDPRFSELWRVTKSRRFPLTGVGRGMYELLRLSSWDTLEEAPEKADVDRWVQALALNGTLVSQVVRHRRGLELSELQVRNLRHALDESLSLSCSVLERLDALMRSGRFGPRARRSFLSAFPEVGAASCAA